MKFNAILFWAALLVPRLCQAWCETRDYVQLCHGTETRDAKPLPIILDVPHDGWLRPASIPDRSGADYRNDRYTRELAILVADEVERITTRRPFLVFNTLHRNKADVNRAPEEGTDGHPGQVAVYRRFHQILTDLRTSPKRHMDCDIGLLVDVHCNSPQEDWMQVFYYVGRSNLLATDAALDSETVWQRSTVRGIFERKAMGYFGGRDSFAEFVRGQNSFGTFMTKAGYDTVPSQSHPNPGQHGTYGTGSGLGSYIIHQHGSRDGGNIDAMQVEIPCGWLQQEAARRALARELAMSIWSVLTHWQGVKVSPSQGTMTCPRPW